MQMEINKHLLIRILYSASLSLTKSGIIQRHRGGILQLASLQVNQWRSKAGLLYYYNPQCCLGDLSRDDCFSFMSLKVQFTERFDPQDLTFVNWLLSISGLDQPAPHMLQIHTHTPQKTKMLSVISVTSLIYSKQIAYHSCLIETCGILRFNYAKVSCLSVEVLFNPNTCTSQ